MPFIAHPVINVCKKGSQYIIHIHMYISLRIYIYLLVLLNQKVSRLGAGVSLTVLYAIGGGPPKKSILPRMHDWCLSDFLYVTYYIYPFTDIELSCVCKYKMRFYVQIFWIYKSFFRKIPPPPPSITPSLLRTKSKIKIKSTYVYTFLSYVTPPPPCLYICILRPPPPHPLTFPQHIPGVSGV